MDINTINALTDPLCRIHSATSSWDDGKLGDQEVNYEPPEHQIRLAARGVALRSSLSTKLIPFEIFSKAGILESS
ncbi:hypothetical protein PILCRDRAFT_8803 [Piloderma croceum F 1598]|uniref:Uncharacterized protein n=1 Tax=Piloderma croceum (strain F 1598) TaxID=765440 RepID=A0A0C3FQL4_PILCF|nr:hypothetical protein PILCRDRAFT_8803 [Piloderma croceum F 1598]